MKLFKIKFNKKKNPTLKYLRPTLFDVKHYWHLSLGICVSIILITGVIGFYLFYYGYFEGYKTEVPPEEFENLIDVKKLKSAIDKRNFYRNESIVLPRDPSLLEINTAPPAGIEPTSTP